MPYYFREEKSKISESQKSLVSGKRVLGILKMCFSQILGHLEDGINICQENMSWIVVIVPLNALKHVHCILIYNWGNPPTPANSDSHPCIGQPLHSLLFENDCHHWILSSRPISINTTRSNSEHCIRNWRYIGNSSDPILFLARRRESKRKLNDRRLWPSRSGTSQGTLRRY